MKQVLMMTMIGGAALALSSCSKEEMPVVNEMDSSFEVFAKEPAPGIYTIVQFTDTGDPELAQFSGYTFEFTADGDFIATTGAGQVFTGFWDLNGAETMMELSIDGTEALEDLDDDNWSVVRISNKGIKLSAPGPDLVAFKKMP